MSVPDSRFWHPPFPVAPWRSRPEIPGCQRGQTAVLSSSTYSAAHQTQLQCVVVQASLLCSGEPRPSSSRKVGPEACRNAPLPEPRRTPRSDRALGLSPDNIASRSRPADGRANRLSAFIADARPRVGGNSGSAGRLWRDPPTPGPGSVGTIESRGSDPLILRPMRGKLFSANSRTNWGRPECRHPLEPRRWRRSDRTTAQAAPRRGEVVGDGCPGSGRADPLRPERSPRVAYG